MQQGQFWAISGVLFVLLRLWLWLRKRSQQPASSSKEESSTNKVDKESMKKNPVLHWTCVECYLEDLSMPGVWSRSMKWHL